MELGIAFLHIRNGTELTVVLSVAVGRVLGTPFLEPSWRMGKG